MCACMYACVEMYIYTHKDKNNVSAVLTMFGGANPLVTHICVGMYIYKFAEHINKHMYVY